MAALVQIGLANACSAALLAVLVAVITRIWRNPHLAHALWLIVLLRLVAPPVFEVPLPAPQWIARQTLPPTAILPENLVVADRPSEREVAANHATSPASGLFAHDKVGHGGTAISPPEPSKPTAEPVDDPAIVPTPAATTPPLAGLGFAFDALGGLWLVGTILYVAITTVRVRRFGLAARRSQSAAPGWLDEEIRDLARRVGLRGTPRGTGVEGSLPPMIWSGRRPTLLVPRAVAVSIAPSQRRLLLLHELV